MGRGYPEMSTLPLLAEELGVSIDSLFKGETQGIAIAGTTIVDIVNVIEKYPEKNMLVKILDTTYAVGGCLPNTIVDIARMDPDIYLSAIGKVGNDENGRYVISQFKKYGIDVSGMKIDDTIPTAADNVMSERVSGERTFFYSGGANKTFGIDDIDVENLDCKIFHIGYILLLDELDEEDEEYGTKMARLLDMVSKKGIKTSIDTVSEEGDRFKEKIVPALKLPKGFIKGSTGAGDAFAAASLYGIYNEWDDKKILEFASAAAACNLTETDSISGMKSAKEIEKMCEEFERRTEI